MTTHIQVQYSDEAASVLARLGDDRRDKLQRMIEAAVGAASPARFDLKLSGYRESCVRGDASSDGLVLVVSIKIG